MNNKLGLLIVGYGGAIGTTIAAAQDLICRELRPKHGMICESVDADGLSLGNKLNAPDLSEIVLSGWDLTEKSLGELLSIHQVLQKSDIEEVSAQRLADKPILAPQPMMINGSPEIEFGRTVQQIRQDIAKFKLDNQLEHVVVVNCISTQETPQWSSAYETLELFKDACTREDQCITSSMKYACAAILESAAFVNFTPNLAAVPAIIELARLKKVPLAGRDGKTGQTFLKTVIAPALKVRGLVVKGWYSINILGNSDGKALSQPDACDTKIKSKESCLDSILGYPVDDHQVHIHYYRPRGDNKEAWDNIDVEGFLGYPMQLKINFLCRDSILAAPLILDLARLIAVAMKRGEFGLLPYLAMFFKHPEITDEDAIEHDLFVQREQFMRWIETCIRDS